MNTDVNCITYEEAQALIREVGILPLAALIPEHPSLESITQKGAWHTGLATDPWLWRVRFPGDGTAAYGKFMKKKSVLIARDLFPYVKIVLSSDKPITARYRDGLVSKATVDVYEAIAEAGCIETRALRAASGLRATEAKKTYDQAILELQASCDIVISGVEERLNAHGEKNGWNSTSFELAGHWMESVDIPEAPVDRDGAKAYILEHLQPVWSDKALAFLRKELRLS